ncbi:FAD-dependent thymidylate synthase [Bacillus megaterium]|jgi:thymidylate synthase (FAD)|nr:FAD-dependent thymidylate synthase [Priestia megaterium]
MNKEYAGKTIDVLDQGYVRLVDYMGSDLEPVNDARVSYDKQVSEWDDKQKGLLNFLGREDHTSPFRGSVLKFEAYVPLMIARQWWKYIIGSDHAEQPLKYHDPFTQWNESSRRYITEEPTFYIVSHDQWRSKPENSKQGSGEMLDSFTGRQLTAMLESTYELGMNMYEQVMEIGVCPEQARLFLPAYGLYVRFRWTASLQGVAHLINQRVAKDAQKEFQDYALAVQELASCPFPNSVKALVKK